MNGKHYKIHFNNSSWCIFCFYIVHLSNCIVYMRPSLWHVMKKSLLIIWYDWQLNWLKYTHSQNGPEEIVSGKTFKIHNKIQNEQQKMNLDTFIILVVTILPTKQHRKSKKISTVIFINFVKFFTVTTQDARYLILEWCMTTRFQIFISFWNWNKLFSVSKANEISLPSATSHTMLGEMAETHLLGVVCVNLSDVVLM